jgi:antitoxin YefM
MRDDDWCVHEHNKTCMSEFTGDAITCSAAPANLAKTMDRTCKDHETLIITRNGEQYVAMLALDDDTADDKALEEAPCLLRSPANGRRLRSAVEPLAADRGTENELAA